MYAHMYMYIATCNQHSWPTEKKILTNILAKTLKESQMFIDYASLHNDNLEL